MVRIVTFYTPDYRQHSDNLLEQAKNLDVKCTSFFYEKKAAWGQTTSLSAIATKRAMDTFGLPLLWLDADSGLKSLPSINSKADIYAPKKKKAVNHRQWGVYSIYFSDTIASRKFINAWALNSGKPSHALCTDEYYFNRTLREMGSKINIQPLNMDFMKLVTTKNAGQVNKELGHLRNVRAWWSKNPKPGNLGDVLTPYMIERELGKSPTWGKDNSIMGAGSTIRLARSGNTIWGSGVMYKDDNIAVGVDVRAVRGKLTRRRLNELDIPCPFIFGDPGLLMPMFYDKPVEKKHSIGVVPHYVDYTHANKILDSHIINPITDNIEQTIDEMRSCECIASSSLHGLVLAEAYNIPHVWVQFSHGGRGLDGDGSKFHDYFSAVGRDNESPTLVGGTGNLRDAFARSMLLPVKKDMRPLWDACPFRFDNITPESSPAENPSSSS